MEEGLRTGLVQGRPPSQDRDSLALTAGAFDRLVQEQQRRIYRILLGLVRDPEVAETLTQDCFLRAFEGRHTYRGEARIVTWLVQIALNLAHDHHRSQRAGFWRRIMGSRRDRDTPEPILRVADSGPAVDRAVMARQRLAVVWAAVDRLAPRQRTCFLLRFVEAMSLDEIAQVMGVEVGTVKVHLARATGAVRRRVSAWEGLCDNI